MANDDDAFPADPARIAGMHCTAGAARLKAPELQTVAAALPGWSILDDRIEKTFGFDDFHATVGFVNAIAWMANRQDHHPDLRVSFNRCVVTWSTHDAGGITRNDLICAAKTDRLLAG